MYPNAANKNEKENVPLSQTIPNAHASGDGVGANSDQKELDQIEMIDETSNREGETKKD